MFYLKLVYLLHTQKLRVEFYNIQCISPFRSNDEDLIILIYIYVALTICLIVAFILYLHRYYRRIYKYINDILLMNFFLAEDNYLHLYPMVKTL